MYTIKEETFVINLKDNGGIWEGWCEYGEWKIIQYFLNKTINSIS